MSRTIQSHESTIRYFRTIGWTIDYDMYLRFNEDSSKNDCWYTVFACRHSSEEYEFVSNFNMYDEMIIATSEWLVNREQGVDSNSC